VSGAHPAPFIGVVMALSFLVMFFRFKSLNTMTPEDKEGYRGSEMMSGDDHNMPEQGKYNGGRKRCSGHGLVRAAAVRFRNLPVRAYFSLPVDVVRLGAVVHSAVAAIMIA